WCTSSAVADCSSSEVGVSPAFADTFAVPVQCRGVSQVFEADDTLVTAITLWSVPTKLFDSQPRTLFVTGAVDSAAPDIHNVIYGPRTVVHLDTDPINPIPYRFEFQPPLQLPQK